ncbi:MAG: hypothetical protein V4632_02550 [Pseudomonadota bacterium]
MSQVIVHVMRQASLFLLAHRMQRCDHFLQLMMRLFEIELHMPAFGNMLIRNGVVVCISQNIFRMVLDKPSSHISICANDGFARLLSLLKPDFCTLENHADAAFYWKDLRARDIQRHAGNFPALLWLLGVLFQVEPAGEGNDKDDTDQVGKCREGVDSKTCQAL